MEKHLLLIDDDPDEFDIFMDALRAAGLNFRYSSALRVKEALEMLQRLIPDYIVLDYNMPKINGLECLAEIKSMQQLKHVPVVMYSASMDEEQVKMAMRLGAAGCIKKPYDMRMLASLLQPFL